MILRKPITNKELQELLKQFSDDAPVITGAFNGEVNTYGVLDEVMCEDYSMITNDFFGTPGPFDERRYLY